VSAVSVARAAPWIETTVTCGQAPALDRPPRRPDATKPPRDEPAGALQIIVRRRPTLPHTRVCSTIGAERLNFRVRNGTGCFPFAMAAETLWSNQDRVCVPVCYSGTTQWTRSIFVEVTSPRPISTGRLRALLPSTSGLSTQSSAGGLTRLLGGKPHLETCFPLRCFQRLSLPNVANQPCSWRNNWHTRGSSIPVLSY
jgi:hypothetical protein